MAKQNIISIIFSFIVAVVSLTGCAGIICINIDDTSPAVGPPYTALTDDIFFSREIMTGEDNGYGYIYEGHALRTELVIKFVAEDVLVLGCSKFRKPPASSEGGYEKMGRWKMIPGSYISMEFYLDSSKTVAYGDYKFEILKVTDGQVTYKRIK